MKDQHRGDKPNFEKGTPKPHSGRPSAPRGDRKPARPGDSRPHSEHREDKPHFDKRGDFKPRDGKPSEHREDKPRFDKRGDFKPRDGKPSEHREDKPHFDKRGDFKHRDGKPSEHREDKPRFDKRDKFAPREDKPRFEHRDPHDRFDRFDRYDRADRPAKPFPPREDRPDFERRPGGRPVFEHRGRFERPPFRPAHALTPDGFKIVTARDAALSALRDVVRNGAYSSQALDRSLNAVELSPEDRRLAASIFYFAVENRLYIEWALNHLMQTKAEPLVEDVMHIAAAQILFMDRIPDHAATDEAVKQVRALGRDGLTGLVNGVLRSLTRARDAGELALPDREAEPEKYLSIRYSFSEAAARRLIAAYGLETAEAIASYTPAERAQTVRPNGMKIDRADFERNLTEIGYMWHKSAVPGAYRILAAGDLSATDDYRRGLFAIQGESSQLAALAVEARPGMQILDACAAPGGKACLMAEAMRGAGRVYAWDLHEHRVELIRAAARRLGLENVRPMTHDARRAPDSMLLSMDAVLVDAPCSGLGVIADKPDVKYRLTDEELDKLPGIQAAILDASAKCVRPGGLLVYSTCTILPEENQKQVRAFLDRHPEFAPETSEKWLPESLRGHMEDGMLSILPHRDGMEGFFIARMRRRDD